MNVVRSYFVVIKSENVRDAQIYVGDTESFINGEPNELLWSDFCGELVLGIFKGKDKKSVLKLAAESNNIHIGNLEAYSLSIQESL